MPWREVIMHNLAWKLLSLLLAVVIYAMIESGVQEQFNPGPRRVLSALPVRTLSSAAEVRAVLLEPDQVEVTLSGPTALEQLRPDDVDVYVNLAGATNGAAQPLRVHVHAPAGTSLVSVKPAEVMVRVVPGRGEIKPQ